MMEGEKKNMERLEQRVDQAEAGLRDAEALCRICHDAIIELKAANDNNIRWQEIQNGDLKDIKRSLSMFNTKLSAFLIAVILSLLTALISVIFR